MTERGRLDAQIIIHFNVFKIYNIKFKMLRHYSILFFATNWLSRTLFPQLNAHFKENFCMK